MWTLYICFGPMLQPENYFPIRNILGLELLFLAWIVYRRVKPGKLSLKTALGQELSAIINIVFSRAPWIFGDYHAILLSRYNIAVFVLLVHQIRVLYNNCFGYAVLLVFLVG